MNINLRFGPPRPDVTISAQADLGEEALCAPFGFVLEGRPDPDDIDAETVQLQGFRITDPTGREQAEREAAYEGA